ncbi:MAG: hypothetical protein P8Y02_04515 [Deinococcales bacterium]
MADDRRSANHSCRPETGQIEGLVFYSSRSASWVMTVVPPGAPPRQQRVNVRFCPWCGRDLAAVTPADDADLLE